MLNTTVDKTWSKPVNVNEDLIYKIRDLIVDCADKSLAHVIKEEKLKLIDVPPEIVDDIIDKIFNDFNVVRWKVLLKNGDQIEGSGNLDNLLSHPNRNERSIKSLVISISNYRFEFSISFDATSYYRKVKIYAKGKSDIVNNFKASAINLMDDNKTGYYLFKHSVVVGFLLFIFYFFYC